LKKYSTYYNLQFSTLRVLVVNTEKLPKKATYLKLVKIGKISNLTALYTINHFLCCHLVADSG